MTQQKQTLEVNGKKLHPRCRPQYAYLMGAARHFGLNWHQIWLWSKLGPGTRNPPSYKARRRLNAVDQYVRHRVENQDVAFSLDKYQDLQTEASGALAAGEFKRNHETKEIESSPWLITDFVTAGSPLSHAEFLLVRDSEGLRNLVRERLLPTCPPVLESYEMNHPDGTVSYSVPSFMFTSGKNGKTFPHHAACFAAVRWTNIYDKPPYYSFPFRRPAFGLRSGQFWRINSRGWWESAGKRTLE